MQFSSYLGSYLNVLGDQIAYLPSLNVECTFIGAVLTTPFTLLL
jgi:hypothetical protein